MIVFKQRVLTQSATTRTLDANRCGWKGFWKAAAQGQKGGSGVSLCWMLRANWRNQKINPRACEQFAYEHKAIEAPNRVRAGESESRESCRCGASNPSPS